MLILLKVSFLMLVSHVAMICNMCQCHSLTVCTSVHPTALCNGYGDHTGQLTVLE